MPFHGEPPGHGSTISRDRRNGLLQRMKFANGEVKYLAVGINRCRSRPLRAFRDTKELARRAVVVDKLTAKTAQCFAFVQGDVIRLVALDLVLRVILAGMVDVALVVHVLGMHPNDSASDSPGLRIPADVIAALERLGHVTTGGF